jgi:hypothetical protein
MQPISRVVGCAGLATLLGAAPMSQQSSATPGSNEWPPFGCPVSPKKDENGESFGNDYLRIILPANSTIIEPERGANWAPDGALKWKIGWERLVKGNLTISGRRIDSPAAPLRSEFHDYGDFGFQATYLIFPTPGCWEVTGHIAGHSLTAVILALQREGLKPTPDQRWRGNRG